MGYKKGREGVRVINADVPCSVQKKSASEFGGSKTDLDRYTRGGILQGVGWG